MKKHLIKILIISILSFLFGCKDSDTKNRLEEIISSDPEKKVDDDWADIYLNIINETKTEHTHIYLAKGLYKNEIVGLKFTINSEINAGIIKGKIDSNTGFVSNAVQLQSIGKESDNFIKALSELYHQTRHDKFTKNIINATAFSLNEKKVDLDKKDRYKLKLFFEEDNEELYSEIYLNIDINLRKIQLREKDWEYRTAIIKVLSK